MVSVRVALLCALSFSLLRGCETQPPTQNTTVQVAPESMQGCYELSLSDWSPDLPLGEDKKFITPPTRISLSVERGSKGFETDGYLLRPAPGEQPSIHRQSFWKPDGADSVLLVWTTGFSGLHMKLHPEGETLKGKAKTFWDFPRTEQTAKVIARRISCGK